MSEIPPDTITFRGAVDYESAEEVLDKLSQLKEIEALEDFNNQVVDLESDEPVIAFTNRVKDDYQNQLTLQAVPSQEQLPEEPPDSEEEWNSDELELDTLAVGVTFGYEDLELLEAAFNEVLNVVESIEVTQFYLSLSLSEDFDGLETMNDLNGETEFDITGVQFEHDNYLFSFQEGEEGTDAYAVYGDNGKIDKDGVQSYIQQRLEVVTPVIEQICYGR
jgi:hypothetical protein